jgi:hypothetical protein
MNEVSDHRFDYPFPGIQIRIDDTFIAMSTLYIIVCY